MSAYCCSECGKAVNVKDGSVTRSCNHESSPIVANIKATAYGSASFANSPPNIVEKIVSKILHNLNIRHV